MDVLNFAQATLDELARQWGEQAERLLLPPVFDDAGELNPEYRVTPAPRLSIRGLRAWVKHLPTERELSAFVGLWALIRNAVR